MTFLDTVCLDGPSAIAPSDSPTEISADSPGHSRYGRANGPANSAAMAPSGGRVKQRMVAKKEEEYKEYADQMKVLAQQYVPPDKDLPQQAYAKGNLTLGPAAGNSNELQLIIHNYLKPQDSMTLVFDKTQKALLQVKIASYMDDPKDVMNLTVTFTSLPDGTNHVSNLVIDGVSKQLNIAIQNSNYQHV
jgi:hypothetical protein